MKKKGRTVANPCLSVADLVGVFSKWLEQALSKDIFALLRPSHEKGFSWKSAADHDWLSEVAPLFVPLTTICPNTVLTSRKMLLTFEALSRDHKIINTSKMSDQVFHEWCDQTVRILFCKYREIKSDSKALVRIQKRCTKKQEAAILQVLSKIKLNDIVDTKVEGNITLSPPKSWDALQPDASKSVSSGHSSAASSANTLQTQDPLTVFSSMFKQILTDTPDADKGENNGIDVKTETNLSDQLIAAAEAAPQDQNNFALGNWKLKENASPLLTPPSPIFDYDVDEDDRMLIKQAMQQAASSKGHTPPAKKTKPKTAKKQKAKAKAKAKVVKKPHSKPDVADQPDRKTLKKRFTSAAYHKALKDAVQDGLEAGDAKDRARIAYKKAAEDFEKSH